MANGARFVQTTMDGDKGSDLTGQSDLLFLVGADGAMRAAVKHRDLTPREGDTLVGLVDPA
jgi:hypothetical protein